jgi:hypothetical protein
MSDYSPLTLKQLCLNTVLRQKGAEALAAPVLPLTLLRELKAAGQILGQYRITGHGSLAVSCSGAQLPEISSREVMLRLFEKRGYAVGKGLLVDLKSGRQECLSEGCPHNVYYFSYFNDAEMRLEHHHLHRVSRTGWEGREEKMHSTRSFRIDAGELMVNFTTQDMGKYMEDVVTYTTTMEFKCERKENVNLDIRYNIK